LQIQGIKSFTCRQLTRPGSGCTGLPAAPDAGPAELAWRWRHNLSFYDALCVALAVVVDAPLVTAPARADRRAGPALPGGV